MAATPPKGGITRSMSRESPMFKKSPASNHGMVQRQSNFGYDPLDMLLKEDKAKVEEKKKKGVFDSLKGAYSKSFKKAKDPAVEYRAAVTDLLDAHVRAADARGVVFRHTFSEPRLGFSVCIARYGVEGRFFVQVEETLPHCPARLLSPTDELIQIGDEVLFRPTPASFPAILSALRGLSRPLALTFLRGERRGDAATEQEERRRMTACDARDADTPRRKALVASAHAGRAAAAQCAANAAGSANKADAAACLLSRARVAALVAKLAALVADIAAVPAVDARDAAAALHACRDCHAAAVAAVSAVEGSVAAARRNALRPDPEAAARQCAADAAAARAAAEAARDARDAAAAESAAAEAGNHADEAREMAAKVDGDVHAGFSKSAAVASFARAAASDAETARAAADAIAPPRISGAPAQAPGAADARCAAAAGAAPPSPFSPYSDDGRGALDAGAASLVRAAIDASSIDDNDHDDGARSAPLASEAELNSGARSAPPVSEAELISGGARAVANLMGDDDGEESSSEDDGDYRPRPSSMTLLAASSMNERLSNASSMTSQPRPGQSLLQWAAQTAAEGTLARPQRYRVTDDEAGMALREAAEALSRRAAFALEETRAQVLQFHALKANDADAAEPSSMRYGDATSKLQALNVAATSAKDARAAVDEAAALVAGAQRRADALPDERRATKARATTGIVDDFAKAVENAAAQAELALKSTRERLPSVKKLAGADAAAAVYYAGGGDDDEVKGETPTVGGAAAMAAVGGAAAAPAAGSSGGARRGGDDDEVKGDAPALGGAAAVATVGAAAGTVFCSAAAAPAAGSSDSARRGGDDDGAATAADSSRGASEVGEDSEAAAVDAGGGDDEEVKGDVPAVGGAVGGAAAAAAFGGAATVPAAGSFGGASFGGASEVGDDVGAATAADSFRGASQVGEDGEAAAQDFGCAAAATMCDESSTSVAPLSESAEAPPWHPTSRWGVVGAPLPSCPKWESDVSDLAAELAAAREASCSRWEGDVSALAAARDVSCPRWEGDVSELAAARSADGAAGDRPEYAAYEQAKRQREPAAHGAPARRRLGHGGVPRRARDDIDEGADDGVRGGDLSDEGEDDSDDGDVDYYEVLALCGVCYVRDDPPTPRTSLAGGLR
ncbi:hypothetical protein M885DRAFT_530816 [Pelagophyceae sp. CCMP2097]|nr:hypothetical protein M885DRAFT_530816 [Pelagophyceae sp. CCMP2097]